MSTTTPPDDGRAFLDPAAPSFASVLAALEAMALPPRHLADLRSAIHTLCRVIGKGPAEVPADPGVLGRAIRRALPAAAGVSPARWANVRSLALKALALTGCKVMPGRSLCPLSPAWAALDARLPSRYFRASLSRLMHFCSAQGIAPGEVDQGIFDRFGEALQRDSFVRNQRVAHQTAARLWNRAVESIPGWPQARIAPPRYRRPYVLALDAFPASFRADAEAWLARLAGEAGLDQGPVRPLRPRSLEQRRFYIRQAASALAHKGRDPATIRGLADLVTGEAFAMVLRFFLERSGNRPTSQIHGLATHLKAMARHHVGVAPADLERLGRMVRRVAPPSQGMAPKNRLALKQLEDPEQIRRLNGLPAAVYAQLPPEGRLTPRRALPYQWALAVEILLAAPVRLGNLCRLELDRHLLCTGSDRKRRYHLLIPGEEVKNGVAIELPLPAGTSRLIELYRTHIRPTLAEPGSLWLFPGRNGPKALVTLGGQIRRFVERRLGLRLTPHQFRHLLGYIYLRQHPHGHEVVRVLLGHRTIATTLKHYAGLEGAQAARLYDEVRQRAGTAATAPKRRRAA